MSAILQAELWKRLVEGHALAGLDLPLYEGRIDLRRLGAPSPTVKGEIETAVGAASVVGDLVVLRGVTWRGIDFSNASLASLRFFDSVIEDCVFDAARCQDWRMWGTTIAGSTFRGADLRRSALGGLDGDKRNSFLHVDFTRADLRSTAHKSADFVECTFSHANLKGVDFQGNVFVGGVFEGELENTLFYDRAFPLDPRLPTNEMEGVDFRRAELRLVSFRKLDLDSIQWPESADHIVLDDYPAALDRVVAGLAGRDDQGAKALAAIFRNYRKWVGPKQRRGVIHKGDLVKYGGEGAVEEFMRLALGRH